METVEWESTVREGQKRKAEVYLPAGYDQQTERRYPVLYVHNGQEALDAGKLENALDHLIGVSVDPVIAVFVIPDADVRRDLGQMDPYIDMVVKELVPAIDGRFRTIAEAWARANAGSGRGANVALQGALKHPEIFGRVAAQSATISADTFKELNKGADAQPLVLYLEWGTYHLRSPHEAWDLAVENRKLWAAMRESGYRPAGGEVPEGYGWPCWNGHTDDWLRAMFPLARPAADRRAAAGSAAATAGGGS
jgi:enterochelin esterase family protein